MRYEIYLFLVIWCIDQGYAECGYKSCHPIKEDQVNVHLVPHTHDDMGWLKTVEQYYYGSHNDIQNAGVQYILTSVIEALQKNPDRRFVYVEVGFFWKWWMQQDEPTKDIVKNLVNNGQLEFISGGWVMNDEATPYYQSVIDQMTLGLKRLNSTFGECGRPRVGWQIDPFGHSREMASILAQLGYDGFFLNRIDYEDHDLRANNGSLEFIWRGSPDNLGEATDIFTNVFFRHYSAPAGLCFDVLCTDEPIIDDPESPEYNVEKKVEDFINNWITPARKGYASNNILVPMGDDFMYQYAGKYFLNMDRLIRYMNGRTINGTTYNVIYSTPSCYLNAVYQSTNGTLNAPLKTDDFYPYASSAHNYWTGYFSSRPNGKGFGRHSNNFLQICKQLSVITNLTSTNDTRKLNNLREAVATFQHHDGITGTERENVSYDYSRILQNGIAKCEELTSESLLHLANSINMSFTTCPLLNISECAKTEQEESLVITIYNPLGRFVRKYIRLPVNDNSTDIIITDPSGTQLTTQFVPIHPAYLKLAGRNSTAQYELVFLASDIPPLGFKSYFFQKNGTRNSTSSIEVLQKKNIAISEDNESITISKLSQNGLKLSVGTGYLYYTGFVGNDTSDEFSSSNPYIFRPDPDIGIQAVSKYYDFETYSGPLGTETHWHFRDWFSYVHRDYDSDFTEFKHLVGPLSLPINGTGMEVVIRFSTDLEYDDQIYTDTNGREIIERVRNYRPSWNVNITEPESGNYYPIVSHVAVKNGTRSGVAIVNDRAQGGGSINYQYIEMMIHRNTIRTGGGVGEILNETAYGLGVVSTGSHYLMFTGSDYSQLKTITPKEKAQEVNLDSWIFFASPNGLTFDEYKNSHIMEYSGLGNTSLPRNVHLLTLEPWGENSVLLRLENFVGKEDPWHYGTATVNIKTMFSAFTVLSARETTLGANQWLSDNERIIFNRQTVNSKRFLVEDDDFDITLEPLEIRTFIVTISY